VGRRPGADLGDKIWFWGSYGRQDLRIQRLNQSRDKTRLDDYSAKVNWQVSPANMFSAFWFNGEKTKLGRPGYGGYGVGAEEVTHSRDQGAAYENGWPHGFLKVEDNHVFSPNFMLNLKLSHYNQGFSLTPQGGTNHDDGVNQVAGLAYGSANYYQSIRPRRQPDAATSAGATSSFGFAYRRASGRARTRRAQRGDGTDRGQPGTVAGSSAS
jgi:hypothetical protein